MHFSFKISTFPHRKFLAFLIVLATTTMSINAFSGGIFSPSTSSISIPTGITVPGNSPAGSILWKSAPISLNLSARQFGSENLVDIGRAEIFANIQSATKTPGYSDVYSTNVSGLGVRWWATWRAPNFLSGSTMPITTNAENNPGAAGWRWTDDARAQDVWIELVKTGSIAGGQLSNLTMNAVLQFHCGTCTSGTVSLTGSTRVVVGPSCTVANSALSVPMGAVPISRFTGVHSTSDPQRFDIMLNCRDGAANSILRPHVTLTDANDISNRGTALTLNTAAASGRPVATGIGIQILKDGTPLGYGPDSSAPGNTNQWSAGTITQGVAQFKISLTANYVQTAAAVTTGQANGRATFTLNYQ